MSMLVATLLDQEPFMTRVVKIYARMSLMLIVVMLVLPAFAQVSQFTADDYFRRALDPFWRTRNMRDEAVLFLQPARTGEKPDGKATWPQAKLLFRPKEVLRVISSDHSTTYQLGRDYVVDEQTG